MISTINMSNHGSPHVNHLIGFLQDNTLASLHVKMIRYIMLSQHFDNVPPVRNHLYQAKLVN
jgi:hypothetical protein